MTETQAKSDPSWLNRSFPEFAELEDNPVYLRELGRRYGGRGGWRVSECCADLLLMSTYFVILFPCFGPILGVVYVPSVLAFCYFLNQLSGAEREQSRLLELHLTELSGWEVLWGRIGGRLTRARQFLQVAAVLAAFALGALLLVPAFNANEPDFMARFKFLTLLLGALVVSVLMALGAFLTVLQFERIRLWRSLTGESFFELLAPYFIYGILNLVGLPLLMTVSEAFSPLEIAFGIALLAFWVLIGLLGAVTSHSALRLSLAALKRQAPRIHERAVRHAAGDS